MVSKPIPLISLYDFKLFSQVNIYLTNNSSQMVLCSTYSPIWGIADLLVFAKLMNVKWYLLTVLIQDIWWEEVKLY